MLTKIKYQVYDQYLETKKPLESAIKEYEHNQDKEVLFKFRWSRYEFWLRLQDCLVHDVARCLARNLRDQS